MKISHWCTSIEGLAGLTHRVREMVEIEKEFGHDSRHSFGVVYKNGFRN